MKLSRNWIADYVDLPADEQLVEVLSMLGLVVDDVRTAGSDLILDLDIPSNRPDAMNHLGIAREIAAATATKVRTPAAAPIESDKKASDYTRVSIDDQVGCPRYVCRVIEDVEIQTSPPWLCERLESIGLRPVNNVADLTNFALWEFGHPLHAFDLDQLEEKRIVVRRAYASEHLVTLDGVDRMLDPQDLVIADAKHPVALAGVMGGEKSSITPGSRRVLLEGAYFDPVTIRKTSRRHGIQTDASHRFERGAAFDGMIAGLDRTAGLVTELAGGTILSGRVDEIAKRLEPPILKLRLARIHQILGIEIDADRARGLLERLNFVVSGGDDGVLEVNVPAARSDVRREIDLVEEVARHHGYDRLPATVPTLRHRSSIEALSPSLSRQRRLRNLCASLGYWEAMTYSFTSEADQRSFCNEELPLVKLAAAPTESMSVLRAHLAPGLLTSIARNRNRGLENIRLFELGRCFQPSSDGVREANHLAFVGFGKAEEPHWATLSRAFDLSDLRGALDCILEILGGSGLRIRSESVVGLDEAASARLLIDGESRGFMGLVSRRVASAAGIDGPIWLAELDVETKLGTEFDTKPLQSLPRFPSAERDLSLMLPSDVTWGRLQQTFSELGDLPLESFSLVDVYQGEDLPEGKYSLTLRLVYRVADRTLTGEEIDAAHKRLVQHLTAELGGCRR